MDKFKELGETLKEIKELEAKASILRKEVLGEVIENVRTAQIRAKPVLG